MLSLNIIGAGRLGKTLGHLWQRQQFFRINAICNRGEQSAQAAQAFIGAGTVYRRIEEMPDADCWLIATGDEAIADAAAQLSARLSATTGKPPLIFHCSGALSADILTPCKPALIASAHPVHSFANPAASTQTFAGTTVALEGDEAALEVLHAAFAALNCELIELSAEQKVLYHAGSVFACNYLTALMDLSLQCFAVAGIDQTRALKLLKPIVLQTAQNNLTLGPQAALTGPIARGDISTVTKQLHALDDLDPLLADCYRQLGLACVKLAGRGELPAQAARQLNQLLSEPAK